MNPALVFTFLTVILLAAIGAGILALVHRRRRPGFVYLVGLGVFLGYLGAVVYLTLLEFQSLLVLKLFVPGLQLRGLGPGQAVNLVPLVGLTYADIKTSVLNILMLVPFGFGLPFLAPLGQRWGLVARTTGLGALGSLGIEVLQGLSGWAAGTAFRVADVNDLIFNTLGAALGAGLFWAYQAALGGSGPSGENRPDVAS